MFRIGVAVIERVHPSRPGTACPIRHWRNELSIVMRCDAFQKIEQPGGTS
jgi:hypothetical protein